MPPYEQGFIFSLITQANIQSHVSLRILIFQSKLLFNAYL